MSSRKPNILLIVLDTLREDYSEPVWEVLKRYGFIKYENVISPAPWTIPTHASIFLGEYPSVHMIHETKKRKVPNFYVSHFSSKDSFFRELKAQGYITYFFSANLFVSPFTGIYQEEFLDIFNGPYKSFLSPMEHAYLKKIHSSSISKVDKLKTLIKNGKYVLLLKIILNKITPKKWKKRKNWPIDKGISSFIKVFDTMVNIKNQKNPWFVFVNFMEMHEPYAPWEKNTGKIYVDHLKTNKLSKKIVETWREKYPFCAKYVADRMEEIIEILIRNYMFENTLIIITSDHGQLLGEHNHIGHGQWLYDELIRVPLYVKYPQKWAERMEEKRQEIGYFSLVNISKYLRSILKSNVENKTIDFLYTDVVFSESHGIHIDVGDVSGENEKKNIYCLEKHRIAVYHGAYKGIYSVDDGAFECIKSYDDAEITEDVENMLLQDINRFLKEVKLKIAVKKLKGRIWV